VAVTCRAPHQDRSWLSHRLDDEAYHEQDDQRYAEKPQADAEPVTTSHG
jgi:hypothetical protein